MTKVPRGHAWYYAVLLPAPSLAHVHHARETRCVLVPDDYRDDPEWGLGMVMEIKSHLCLRCGQPYWRGESEPECMADDKLLRKNLRGGKNDRKWRAVAEPGQTALERAQRGEIVADIIGLPGPAEPEPEEEIVDIPALLSILDGLGHDWVYQLWIPAPSASHARTASANPFVTLPHDYADTPGWNGPVLIDIEKISCSACGEEYEPSTRKVCQPGMKRPTHASRSRREDVALMQASRIAGLA